MTNSLGQFVKGEAPWNKGVTGYMGANKTSFKLGDMPASTLPAGTISKRLRHKEDKVDEWYINIDWKGNRKVNNSYKWYLWEVENQQDRPIGYVLAFINGDQSDVRLDNLEMITRAENLFRNRR